MELLHLIAGLEGAKVLVTSHVTTTIASYIYPKSPTICTFFLPSRRYKHSLNAALVDARVGRVRPPVAELSGFEPGRVGAESNPPADCCWKGVGYSGDVVQA